MSSGVTIYSKFAPFCNCANRHIKAGTFTVTYGGEQLKVDELLPHGRLRLRRDGTSYNVPFEADIIEELLTQIV